MFHSYLNAFKSVGMSPQVRQCHFACMNCPNSQKYKKKFMTKSQAFYKNTTAN